jgi:anaerobic selenocysteine-containing dehydrogenase
VTVSDEQELAVSEAADVSRSMGISRRSLLTGSVAVGAAGVAGVAVIAGQEVGAETVPSLPVERVVRTTCSPNCTGGCGQLAFVRDAKVVKIQQAADYPDAEYPGIPSKCGGINYEEW